MPSILITSICFLPNIGGVETHLNDLVSELHSHDWQVTVLTYQPLNTPVLGQWIEHSPEATIYRLPILRGLFYKLVSRPLLEFVFLFPLQFIFLPIVLLIHPSISIINAQGLVAGSAAAFWAPVFRKKYVAAAQSIYHFPSSGLYRRFSNWVFGRAQKVLVQSVASQQEMIDLGVSKSKLVIFTHWENTDQFSLQDKSVNKTKLGLASKFVVSFFGRLVPEKGIIPLISSLPKILPEITLLIYGEGPLLPMIKSACQKYHNVTYMGTVTPNNLPVHFGAADLLIVPSTGEEGFGRVVVEALLCSTPVIVSNRGALSTVINSTVGQVIDPTPDKIAQMINQLYLNPELLQKLTNHTRSFALKNYSSKNANKIISTFSACISSTNKVF